MSLRRIGIAIVALAAVAGMLLILAHAPFVRRAVLGYARSVVQRDYGLTLDASRLDYNLGTFSMGLADVRLFAEGSANEPFFESDYVGVRLSSGVLFGNLLIRDVSITNGRVRVHRRADGTSNLPSSAGNPDAEPAAIPIDRLDVPRLTIDVLDEQADLQTQFPAMAVLLMRDSGSISLTRPANIRVGRQMTTISALNTQATFDGRTLRLTGGQLRSDEATIEVDGSLQLIAREPSFDLQVKGTGDVARLARWGIPEGDVPEGAVAFDGQIAGPLADPRAQLNLASARIAFGDMAVTDVTGRTLASTTAIEVESLEFGIASGRVQATASVPFAVDAERRVGASWGAVDATSATRLFAPDLEYLPSGLSSGELTAMGMGTDVSMWQGSLRLRVGGARNSRGRLAVPGETTVTLSNARWQLAASHTLAGVAPVALDARGGVKTGQPLSDLMMDAGRVTLGGTDIATLMTALRDTGLVSVDPAVVTAGRVEATFDLAGRLVDPEASGNASAAGVVGQRFEIASVRAEVEGRPFQPSLTYSVAAPEAVVSGQRLRDVSASGRLTASAGPLRGTRPTVGGAAGPSDGTRPTVGGAAGPSGGTRPAGETGSVLVLDTVSVSQADGSGRLSGSATYELTSGRYSTSLEGADWLLVPTDEQPVRGVVDLRFAGMGTLEAPQGEGEVSVRDAAWQGTELGALTASVTLDGGPAARIEARAPEFNATATARVEMAAPYASVVDVRTDNLDLARILRDIETPALIGGLATGSIHFEGPLELWRTGAALVDVAALDATVGDLSVRLAEPARLRYETELVHIDRLEARLGETALSASGALPVFDAVPDSPAAPAVLVVMTGGVREVALAVAATGLTDVPLAGGSGPVALLARVTGSVEAPVYAADLEVGPGSITLQDLPTVSGLSLKVHAGDGWFELREAVGSYQSASFTATGKAPLSWLQPAAGGAPGGGEVHARATNLTAAVLAPFFDPATVDQVSGSIDITLNAASATPDIGAVMGELQIDRLDVRVADLPIVQRVPTRIVARDGIAHVEAWDWTGQGATLGVSGQIGLVDRQAALLANGSVDLRVLTPFTRNAGVTTAGRFQPRISIIGPLDSPRIDGDATIMGGEIRLADPRVLVSDLETQVTLNGRSAQITSLTGMVNGGPMTGSGSFDYTSDGGLGVQLSTSVRGVALEFPTGLRSEVDADINLTASSMLGAGRLSGTITVVRGSYREPLAVVTGLLTSLRTEALSGTTESSPLLSALALDIQLDTDEDVIVDNNYGRFELGADLRIIGTAAVPALSGRADLREGGQLFVGRNVYTVNSGAIDFSNPVVIEPNLNIEASTRVSNVDIEVTITGSAEAPTVDLRSSSNPELGQAEVASLLLTGRRLEDLPTDDAAFVGTQVLGNFSAEVLGFASRAVGLDTIRLGGIDTQTARRDPSEIETDIDPTTRLTFGKSLGSNVNVTFSQSLRNSDAQAWIVEYMVRRGLELRLVSNDEDLRSYGFRHDVSFGTGARPIRPGTASREATEVRVTLVNVSGDLALPEARVRDALRLGSGDRFDFVDWQSDRDRLVDLYRDAGYFTARITSRRAEEADGVVLNYEIAGGPQTRIVATGIDLDAGLRSQLETAWVESAFDDIVTGDASQIIRANLARQGYLQPEVDVRIREEGDTKTLELFVDPGPRSIRTIVRVEGATETLAGELESHLVERGLVEGVVADPRAIEREGLSYLRASGYLRAQVSAGAPVFEGDTAIFPVRVDSGPVFTVASVSFTGAQGLPDEDLREAAGLADAMPYDPSLLDAARNRLVALHRREGYTTAIVAVRPAVHEDAPLVDVVFAVTEGARETLADVTVVGNRGIDTDVVVQAIDISVGAPLRTEELLTARTRLFETGLFRRVDIASEPVESPGGDSGVAPMRLRVTVEEWPALRLRYGVLIAEEFRPDDTGRRELVPGLSADVSRRTLFGRAITVGTAVGLQRRERRGRVFINTPTLLRLPIESSLIAERSHEEFEGVTFQTDLSRITWEQRARPARTVNLSYSYTFERNRTFDTKPPDPFVPALDITINIARLNAAAAWDTRDDPSDTTRGLLTSASLEFAPEELGSDIRFVRQVAQAYYFRPWRSLVFASAARVGVVTPLAGQELIPSERFLAGGSRTVRGVPENGLGPQDFFGGSSGGKAMIVLNQEVRWPIYRWLRGVAFVDAGNVFAERGDANLSDLVGSLGFGLRLATPLALLRVDFARTAWGSDTPSSGRWIIGIGHAF